MNISYTHVDILKKTLILHFSSLLIMRIFVILSACLMQMKLEMTIPISHFKYKFSTPLPLIS